MRLLSFLLLGLALSITAHAKTSLSHAVICDNHPVCLIYQVTIDDDGTAIFEGGRNTVISGKHAYRVEAGQVTPLLKNLDRIDFWNLPDTYSGPGVDILGHRLTAINENREKSVTDFLGEPVGLPSEVHEIENAVDKVALIDEWLNPTSKTLHLLDAEGFDYTSPIAAQMAVDAVLKSEVGDDFISALITRGVPLEGGKVSGRISSKNVNLFDAAAFAGRSKVMTNLIDEGFEPRQSNLGQTFAYAIRSGDLKAVKVMLSLNPPMMFPPPASFYPEVYEEPPAISQTPPVISTESALHEVRNGRESLSIVKALLEAGADPNGVNSKGQTPILVAVNEDVVMYLLEQGADARLHDPGGQALEMRARNYRWNRVLDWIKAHDFQSSQ